jgi:hypothetical protein
MITRHVATEVDQLPKRRRHIWNILQIMDSAERKQTADMKL